MARYRQNGTKCKSQIEIAEKDAKSFTTILLIYYYHISLVIKYSDLKL
jgi:hypothetical protein